MPATASSARRSERARATLLDATAHRRPPAIAPPIMATVAACLVVVALVGSMWATRREGHAWGDDFALYVRQAEALTTGGVGDVRADNVFTLDNSANPDFSPPAYPWGLPLLLAVPVWAFGVDLDRLALVGLVSAAVFLGAWWAMIRRRLAAPVPLLTTVVLGASPVFAVWSDAIHSELPFLAAVFVTIAAVDRLGEHAATGWLGGRHLPLLVVGLLAATCFSIRREGLAVIVMIGAAQLAAWTIDKPRLDRKLVARLAVPHAAFVAAVALLQLVLPSTLVPRYEGSSPLNLFEFRAAYLRGGGEILGGATWVGIAVAALGVMGIVVRASQRADAPLAAYLVTVTVIGGSIHIPSTRYIATSVPLLLYFAVAGLLTLGNRSRDPRRRLGVAAVVVAALSVTFVHAAADRVAAMRDAARSRAAGEIVWGPEHPDAQAMFAAVDELAEPDDVVGFAKARALTLYTDRRAVQVGANRTVVDVADRIEIVVLELDDHNVADVVADPDRFTEIWSSDRYRMWRVTEP